jgi:hypothetical protein
VRQQLAAEKRAAQATARKAAAPAPAAPPTGADRAGRGDAAALDAVPALAPPAAPAPRLPLGQPMRQRCEAAVAALDEAAADGREHLCLTDPDARMMGGGRERKVRECHSWEVAVDQEAGLLVAAQVSQDASDNARLEPLVAAAQRQEPAGVKAVDGDSGFYSGGAIGRLEAAGIDTCVPDSNTAGDLHRGQRAGAVRDAGRGQIRFTYDPERDLYRCPEGNELVYSQTSEQGGQRVTQYRAKRDCRDCPLAGECLSQANARHRTVKVGEYQAVLEAARQRFNEPEHQTRYRHRGEVVETVFGFVRGTLGYLRWQLRGKEKVAKEARLLALAYQFRKVHGAWAAG